MKKEEENNLWARFGKVVYRKRKHKNWSQFELAVNTWPELNHVNMRVKISNLERGQGRLHMPDALRLCRILEINEYDLLSPILDPRLDLLYPNPQIFERWPYLKSACRILEVARESNSQDLLLMAEEELRKTVYQLKEERRKARDADGIRPQTQRGDGRDHGHPQET
jgi:transcriptional regulator with XRE-family HTH domain